MVSVYRSRQIAKGILSELPRMDACGIRAILSRLNSGALRRNG